MAAVERSAWRTRTYNALTALVTAGLGVVSPRRALLYRAEREFLRSYAAADPGGHNQNWRPRNRSADAEIRRGQKLITARARDLARNNSHVAGAIRRIANNVVRKGIRPQAQFHLSDGKPDAVRNRYVESLFRRWGRYADHAGHDSIAAIQRLVLRHVWADGECLVLRAWDNSLPGIPPLRLEVLECDLLDTRIDGQMTNGNLARRGIEYDSATNRPLFYHLLDSHPGDHRALGGGKTIRVPAANVIHVYDRQRSSQTRGISWLAAVLMDAYDLGEYKATEMIGARLAAAFGIFVKNAYPELAGGFGIPGGQVGAGGQPAADTGKMPDYIEPGRIQALPPGTEIQVASHNRPGTQYEPFIRDNHRGMSVGTGMSYESYSNDYSAASYSSARSASLEERLGYQEQQWFLNEKLNNRVWAWFLDAAYLAGLLPNARDYAHDPLPWHEAVIWQNPGWTWVDPLKDSKAVESGIDNATTTRTKTAAQQGEDWEDDVLPTLIHEEEQLARLYELRRKNRQAKEEMNNGADA